MPDLPAGTVTFLFTDIEGSTKLLQHDLREYHLKETGSGKCSATLSLQPDVVYALTWLPDGKHVAFASGDRAVKVWRAR